MPATQLFDHLLSSLLIKPRSAALLLLMMCESPYVVVLRAVKPIPVVAGVNAIILGAILACAVVAEGA